MTDQKCVVEGCNLEYDVICSFSFYNVNTLAEQPPERQEWIAGAMKEDGECLWRHVSLHLCGYHFEMDSQGLWIDSPMLPELLTPQKPPAPEIIPTEEQKHSAELIKVDHNYNAEQPPEENEPISRLNVRQLVDTLGFLSLKNLQKKQLWVVKVEADKTEASITESEQVITKMNEPQQIIEIIPQEKPLSPEPKSPSQSAGNSSLDEDRLVCQIDDDDINMDSARTPHQAWTLNIVPQEAKPKYAFVKHVNSGAKKRHFTSDINEVTINEDNLNNYYILPDADPSVGVEVTTSDGQSGYLVEDYDDMILQMPRTKKFKQRPQRKDAPIKRKIKKDKASTVREQVKSIQTEIGSNWFIEQVSYEDQDESEDYKPKPKSKAKGRRRNRKNEFDLGT